MQHLAGATIGVVLHVGADGRRRPLRGRPAALRHHQCCNAVVVHPLVAKRGAGTGQTVTLSRIAHTGLTSLALLLVLSYWVPLSQKLTRTPSSAALPAATHAFPAQPQIVLKCQCKYDDPGKLHHPGCMHEKWHLGTGLGSAQRPRSEWW